MKRDQPIPLETLIEERALDRDERSRQGFGTRKPCPDALNKCATPRPSKKIPGANNAKADTL